MTTEKKNSQKTIVFMSTEFFCSVSDDLLEKDDVCARYFNIPEEQTFLFRHRLYHAYIHFFLDRSIKEKIITKEILAKAYLQLADFPVYLENIRVTAEQVIEAIEKPSVYSFNKKDNYLEVSAMIKHLYENGYNLILKDDMPENIITEALQQMNLLQYFKSVQGIMGNYLTLSVNGMKKLVGLNDPKDFLVVTSGDGKTDIIDAAREVRIPVMTCKNYCITELYNFL